MMQENETNPPPSRQRPTISARAIYVTLLALLSPLLVLAIEAKPTDLLNFFYPFIGLAIAVLEPIAFVAGLSLAVDAKKFFWAWISLVTLLAPIYTLLKLFSEPWC